MRPIRRSALWAIRRRDVRPLPHVVGRFVDLALVVQQPNVAERRQTVDDLVNLFFALCAVRRADVFIEAGAKEASASRRAAEEVGIERVVAFEANPYTFARFSSGFDQLDVEYRHLALAARDEAVTFMVRRHADGTPIPDGQGSLLHRPGHAPGYDYVTVSAVRLDSFFGDRPFERGAMWVDVEGATDQVFGGAESVLASCDLVLVEVESRINWDGQVWLDVDVVRAMRDAGLRPVARDAQSRFQYNVLFVRDSAVGDPGVVALIDEWRSTP